MKVTCAYCTKEGKPALLREKEPLDDPRVTHGVCPEHQRRLVRATGEPLSERPLWVREPATPDIEDKPIRPLRVRARGHPVATRTRARLFVPIPQPICYLYRGARTWMLSQEIPEDERRWSPHSTATGLPRDVNVEIALQTVQAERPEYEIRVLNWYRPKRD